MPVFLNTSDAGFEISFDALLNIKRESDADVDAVVAEIISDVQNNWRCGCY